MPAPVKIGYLGANGHPHVRIKVWGFAEQFAQEFEALIDTGFTGFLSIPLTAAFPLALALVGTTNYQLADGSVSPRLLAFGTVALEDESAYGTVVLESHSTGLLVGMEFLKKLNRALLVSKAGVWLVDEDVLAAARAATTPTIPTVESEPPQDSPAKDPPRDESGD